MNNPYDIHAWSKDYREERLAEASRWHLVKRANGNRRPRSRLGRVGFALSGALHGLKG